MTEKLRENQVVVAEALCLSPLCCDSPPTNPQRLQASVYLQPNKSFFRGEKTSVLVWDGLDECPILGVSYLFIVFFLATIRRTDINRDSLYNQHLLTSANRSKRSKAYSWRTTMNSAPSNASLSGGKSLNTSATHSPVHQHQQPQIASPSFESSSRRSGSHSSSVAASARNNQSNKKQHKNSRKPRYMDEDDMAESVRNPSI